MRAKPVSRKVSQQEEINKRLSLPADLRCFHITLTLINNNVEKLQENKTQVFLLVFVLFWRIKFESFVIAIYNVVVSFLFWSKQSFQKLNISERDRDTRFDLVKNGIIGKILMSRAHGRPLKIFVVLIYIFN